MLLWKMDCVNCVTEKMFLQQVIDLAHLTGWLVFHVHDSRRCPGPGFPDLTLVHPQRGFLMAELKSATGRLSPAQAAWLDALHAAGVEVAVWRPGDLDGAIVARLTSCPQVGISRAIMNGVDRHTGQPYQAARETNRKDQDHDRS